jgi:hypothetical protein
MKPVHSVSSYFLNFYFYVIRPSAPSPIRANCPFLIILLDSTNVIIFSEYKSRTSSASCDCLRLRAKWFPKHPIFESSQTIFFPQCWRIHRELAKLELFVLQNVYCQIANGKTKILLFIWQHEYLRHSKHSDI